MHIKLVHFLKKLKFTSSFYNVKLVMNAITPNIKTTSDYDHFLIFIFLVKNQFNVVGHSKAFMTMLLIYHGNMWYDWNRTFKNNH
jgi:hypothetical protein